MESEQKRKIVTVVFWGLIILALVFMIVSIYFMYSKTGQCIKNPFGYSLGTITDKEAYAECNCIVSKDNQMQRFSFNKTNIWLEKE